MYELPRIIIEIVSAIICFILLRFMIKPYSLTGEKRYIGLPTAFGILGVTYLISAFVYIQPNILPKETLWFQLIARTFAFIFLATTYYFSKKSSKNSRQIWTLTYTSLIIAIITLSLAVIISPNLAMENYNTAQTYVRVLNIICLVYVSIHTFRSVIENPDSKTIWTAIGFIFIVINQYSLLFWAIDRSFSAFVASLAIRLAGLIVFLAVSLFTFQNTKEKRCTDEENIA